MHSTLGSPARPGGRRVLAALAAFAAFLAAPAVLVARGCDAMSLIEAAVRKISGPLTRDALRTALETVSIAAGSGVLRLSPTSHGLDPESQSMVHVVANSGQWFVAGA